MNNKLLQILMNKMGHQIKISKHVDCWFNLFLLLYIGAK